MNDIWLIYLVIAINLFVISYVYLRPFLLERFDPETSVIEKEGFFYVLTLVFIIPLTMWGIVHPLLEIFLKPYLVYDSIVTNIRDRKEAFNKLIGI